MSNLQTFLEIQEYLKSFSAVLQLNPHYQQHIESIQTIITRLQTEDNPETIPYDLINNAYDLFSEPERVKNPDYDFYVRRKITPEIIKIKDTREASIKLKLDEKITAIKLDEPFEIQINNILTFCNGLLEQEFPGHLIYRQLMLGKKKVTFNDEQWKCYRDKLVNEFRPARIGTIELTEVIAYPRGYTVKYSKTARERTSRNIEFIHSRRMSTPVPPTQAEQDDLCDKFNSLKIKQ